MSVYLDGTSVLLDGTSVATDAACCCTGACCVGSDCSIQTQSDCVGMGGTYQGNGTPCDPNPCPLPCCQGCTVFEFGGNFYLTKEVNLTSSTHCTAFGDIETSTANITSRADYNPSDCSITYTCSGGADTHNCPEFGDVHFNWTNCGFPGDCGWDHGGSCPCCTDNPLYTVYCFGGGGGCPTGSLIDQVDSCSSHLDNGVCLIDVTVTVTYSNPCDNFC